MSDANMKIIWTVDPFAKDKNLQRSAAWAIKDLTHGIQCIIEPVYFFSAYLTSDSPLEVPKDWIHDIQKSGQVELTRLLSRIHLDGIKPLHIISEPYLSMRDGIDRISQIAKRWEADLIVTSTHARKGIKRWILGSFAETQLLHSDLPQLFVNPNWDRKSGFKSILFPTDFSNESHEAFSQVIQLAKSKGSEIFLFHKLMYTWPPTVLLSANAYPLYTSMFDNELENRNKDALKWAEEAQSEGVSITTSVDIKQGEPVVQSILKLAKKHPGLIAMVSKSGPTKTALLGSTTRNLVRDSPFPVWVLQPRLKTEVLIEKKSA